MEKAREGKRREKKVLIGTLHAFSHQCIPFSGVQQAIYSEQTK